MSPAAALTTSTYVWKSSASSALTTCSGRIVVLFSFVEISFASDAALHELVARLEDHLLHLRAHLQPRGEVLGDHLRHRRLGEGTLTVVRHGHNRRSTAEWAGRSSPGRGCAANRARDVAPLAPNNGSEQCLSATAGATRIRSRRWSIDCESSLLGNSFGERSAVVMRCRPSQRHAHAAQTSRGGGARDGARHEPPPSRGRVDRGGCRLHAVDLPLRAWSGRPSPSVRIPRRLDGRVRRRVRRGLRHLLHPFRRRLVVVAAPPSPSPIKTPSLSCSWRTRIRTTALAPWRFWRACGTFLRGDGAVRALLVVVPDRELDWWRLAARAVDASDFDLDVVGESRALATPVATLRAAAPRRRRGSPAASAIASRCS